MTILLDEKTVTIIQGITGREGTVRARFMKEYGTKIVAGVTPGRGGGKVWGIPVYDTVKMALKEHGSIDASVTFVPGFLVKDAVMEAIDAKIKLIIVPSEHVPLHDILEMVAYSKQKKSRIIGPGSIGIISPGKAAAGWLGGTLEVAREVFEPGSVGVMSRSGGQASTIPWSLKSAGIGVGTSFADILPLFEKDDETKAVAMFGEIGSVNEEEAAKVIEEDKFTKPLVAYIAGAWAREGMRFSHASAIIEHGKGKAENKIMALKKVGAHVVERPEEIAPVMKQLLKL
jgi:succinyl-CoA synthetase alpha subunit